MDEIYEKLTKVFREVFDDDSIVLTRKPLPMTLRTGTALSTSI